MSRAGQRRTCATDCWLAAGNLCGGADETSITLSFGVCGGACGISTSCAFKMPGLSGSQDDAVLEWAADQNRVLLTRDVTTITDRAHRRLMRGVSLPGVIEDLILTWAA